MAQKTCVDISLKDFKNSMKTQRNLGTLMDWRQKIRQLSFPIRDETMSTGSNLDGGDIYLYSEMINIFNELIASKTQKCFFQLPY